MKKLFIIVLYKTEIEKCLTVNSFIECNLFKNTDSYFCVWDNSPEALSERDRNYVESLGKNVVYESHPENTPLAKVYNLVLQNIRIVITSLFLTKTRSCLIQIMKI